MVTTSDDGLMLLKITAITDIDTDNRYTCICYATRRKGMDEN